MSTKKVTVWSSVGGSKVIETEASNWSELQKQLSKENVKTDGMKAVTGDKITLEHPEAVLPAGDLNLFLFPVQTKSGAGAASMSFNDIRAFIKLAIEKDPEGAKAHFNEGKNYTNKGTDELRGLVDSYKPSKKKASSASTGATSTSVSKAKTPAKEAPKANVADVVKSVSSRTVKETVPAKTDKQSNELIGPDDVKIDSMIAAVKTLGAGSTLKEDAIKALNKLRPSAVGAIDEDALAKQAREISQGLTGIRR